MNKSISFQFQQVLGVFVNVFCGLVIILSWSNFSHAAEEQPRVGRKAAAKYFQAQPSTREPAAANSENMLMLHVGGFSQSTSYVWKGSDKRNGVGQATYGVTYLFDRWGGMDVNLRFDFTEYKLDSDRATKLSFLPLLTFPSISTGFPLYFGLGAGPGVFFTQVSEESNLSLDYQLVTGVRFTDLVEHIGVFVEFGLKNHLLLLSDGQFNGTALTAGAIFTF